MKFEYFFLLFSFVLVSGFFILIWLQLCIVLNILKFLKANEVSFFSGFVSINPLEFWDGSVKKRFPKKAELVDKVKDFLRLQIKIFLGIIFLCFITFLLAVFFVKK